MYKQFSKDIYYNNHDSMEFIVSITPLEFHLKAMDGFHRKTIGLVIMQ